MTRVLLPLNPPGVVFNSQGMDFKGFKMVCMKSHFLMGTINGSNKCAARMDRLILLKFFFFFFKPHNLKEGRKKIPTRLTFYVTYFVLILESLL